MAGMETKLHAVINKPGVYDGFSANYSGAGFSGMNFKFHGMSEADFKAWVDKVKASGDDLSVSAYEALAKPSSDVPVHYYKSVAPDLYHDILNRCVGHAEPCMDKVMAMDHGHKATGGGAKSDEAKMADMPGMAHHGSGVAGKAAADSGAAAARD
jgi:cytochrome o ubiquinol oxidase subunit 2